MSTSQISPQNETLGTLSLLQRIATFVATCPDARDAVRPSLETLVQDSVREAAMLTIFSRDTRAIHIEEACGLSDAERARGRYRLGEGVTGRVVQTGRPVVVPRVSLAREFLDRTGLVGDPSHDRSFVCVPVLLETSVIGAVSTMRAPSDDVELARETALLQVVAALLAQAVRLRQGAYEETARLQAGESQPEPTLLRPLRRPVELIGRSKSIQDVLALVQQVAATSTTVLILGESGTGKELIARAIHTNSARHDGPFIKVNCGALPENLVESELFGHEKGAFTGALQQRKGRFELAHGGTLLLDEVGELTAMAQVKLLRVLQEREFERVGGSTTLRADVRVVAATSRDLEQMVEAGTFRRDLYYRLAVFPMMMPPLRERGSDVILLADHFVNRFNRQHLKQVRRIATSAIDALLAYHWPGNVRELENCIERGVLLSTDDVIHSHHLPPSLQTAESTGTAFEGDLQQRLDAIERGFVIDALKSHQGNLAATARALGITERIMGLRVRKYQLDCTRFRRNDAAE